MNITHNMTAINANRQLNINGKVLSVRQEKLSSGYKINRSADDSAGLSISEKMRRQIRGLNKTLENIQDGISLCQTADGALTEVHEILQRMNELAVKAANGTNHSSDREALQKEAVQLLSELTELHTARKYLGYIPCSEMRTSPKLLIPHRIMRSIHWKKQKFMTAAAVSDSWQKA